MKKDGNCPEINEQIMEIYNRFAGDPNFPIILSELKFPDYKINLENTIAFCTAQINRINYLIEKSFVTYDNILGRVNYPAVSSNELQSQGL